MSSIDVGDQKVPIVNVQPLRNGDDNRDVQRLARSAAGKRAAAVATGHLAYAFLSGGTQAQQEKAQEIIADVTRTLQGAEPMTQPAEIVLPASYTPEPEPEAVATDYELPADLEALLDEPEDVYEDDEPDEPAAVADDDEYVDPEVARLRKQLEKTQKKAEHERKLRVQTARKDWEAEAARVFRLGDTPLLDDTEIKQIRADSKRGFMVEARAIADRNKQVALRFQTPGRPAAPAAPTAAEVWGAPPGDGTSVPAERVGANPRLERARRNGNLTDIFRERIFGDTNS